MGGENDRSSRAWRLSRRQHGVITRRQLLALGFSAKAIEHRLSDGRLFSVWPGVYAVGRRELGRLGLWMAAVLACGDGVALSHSSAAALWGFGSERNGIHVCVPHDRRVRRTGITAHRRNDLTPVTHHGIPVTSPLDTLVDMAATEGHRTLESAINEANALELIDPRTLRARLDEYGRRAGAGALRRLLDRHAYRFTRSGVERRFLALALEAGMPLPETNVFVCGFEVDFYWPNLALIVETDSLTYHRTAGQQAADRLRDQVHTAAGLTTLRFTEAQIKYEPEHVKRVLRQTAATLAAA